VSDMATGMQLVSTPEEFQNFFVAAAGVSDALIGLLFVATSIAPERTVEVRAAAVTQETAAGAYILLGNVLILALGALIPGLSFGALVVGMSISALLGTMRYAAISLKTEPKVELGFGGPSDASAPLRW